MGSTRIGDLAHKAGILENVQGFLVTLPVFRTHHHKIRSGTACYAKRHVLVNYLFNKTF
jgi:hypothetical protein